MEWPEPSHVASVLWIMRWENFGSQTLLYVLLVVINSFFPLPTTIYLKVEDDVTSKARWMDVDGDGGASCRTSFSEY